MCSVVPLTGMVTRQQVNVTLFPNLLQYMGSVVPLTGMVTRQQVNVTLFLICYSLCAALSR